ncbi:hypothetical protein Skr01_48280 [Sphaerisporangium krabiense]|nr:BlaI/MecI/CopY family transcriptional regulator [Sphaerisporangium krabiense]GII64743.1 hypothetical protein Skr01_48280 [Sphaerisporangium krabiense]
MRLGNLERSVMEALWDRPDGMFAQEVADALDPRPAVTTVLTVLVRLSRKGMVARERRGRAHVYRAAGDRDAFVAQAMQAALDEAGDVAAAVSHFVGTVSPEVAAALREALNGRGDDEDGA